MSMCNNDVTYHEKWDTMENNAALKKLDNKYFDRSICTPSCPVGWAPEVLELLERLNKEFGIARNTETIRAYRVTNTMLELIFKATYNNVSYALKTKEDRRGNKYTLKQRLQRAKAEAVRTLTYARKAFMVKYLNKILNVIFRPKIVLSQVKEKFGYLTLYIGCEDRYKEYIHGLIREVTIKLATKGCYYPLETLTKKVET